MSTETIEWTPDGEGSLFESRQRYTIHSYVDRAVIRAKLDESLARFIPCYERGLEIQGGPLQHEAVDAVKKFVGGEPEVSETEAAYALSLLGSRSGEHGHALAELLIRDRGFAFVVRALVEMWSMATNYRDPDWPKHEKRLAIWLVQQFETSSANDASVSHGKSDTAAYLAAYSRFGSKEQRAEIHAAVVKEWNKAPLHARPALAVAAYDGKLAEKVARELVEKESDWHWHYGERVLPDLLADVKLFDAIKSNYYRLGFPYLDNHGLAALPLFVREFGGKLVKSAREEMMKVLVNIRGPVVARMLAPYAELAPFTPHVRGYFTRYPELLAEVQADKKLAKHRAQLDKLASKIGAGEKKSTAVVKQMPAKQPSSRSMANRKRSTPIAKPTATTKPATKSAATKSAAKKPAAKKPAAKKPAAKRR